MIDDGTTSSARINNWTGPEVHLCLSITPQTGRFISLQWLTLNNDTLWFSKQTASIQFDMWGFFLVWKKRWEETGSWKSQCCNALFWYTWDPQSILRHQYWWNDHVSSTSRQFWTLKKTKQFDPSKFWWRHPNHIFK